MAAPVLAARGPLLVDEVPDVDIVASPPARVVETALEPNFSHEVPTDLKTAITQSLKTPVLRGSRVSLFAARVSDGVPLISLNPDETLNPASCVKLMTSAAALRVLRPNHRFLTEYLASGTLERGVLKGNLVVRGTGDPTLTTERLFHVAGELVARGLHTVKGDLILDDSYFDTATEPPGWEQESQWDRAYAAPLGALSLNQNALAIYLRPGTHPGTRAVVVVDPPTEGVVIDNHVTTTRSGRRLWVKAIPDGDRTKVLVQGVIGLHEPAERYVRRIHNPTAHFGHSLMAMLKLRGIQVKGQVRVGVTPDNVWQLFEDRSASLRSVVNMLNHHSSNFVAEVLLKAVGAHMMGAPGSTEKGLRVVSAVLERDMGIEAGSYIMGNGSGLNDINRFSTVQMVKVLRRMALDPMLGPEFVGSLAVAGSTGTLSHRMGQTAAEGQLRGKTGTLLGVSALSGYVETPKHGLVAFSFVINGLSGPVSSAWDIQDRMGAALAGDDATVIFRARPMAMPEGNSEVVPGGGTP
jgi:D-alanyl-D-alanine carboxypeptidase/D-alanyl-D-alanine-endopeptidase (penicillin-binding protein 4)